MKLKLPQYNGKDNLVMWIIMPAFSLTINSTILGWRYFSSWEVFLLATVISTIAGCIDFILCGLVAVALKNRFPNEDQLLKRLTLMISTFLLISGLYLYSLFRGYELIAMFNYRFNEHGFVWSYLTLGILNIFLTFLMEGISRYKEWQENRKETEKLSEIYKQGQLNGLKSQVNPHFLFNSLNSLSSLIQDSEEKAEQFLDEMSKVYRYMLRSDDEQLVTLDTELKFVHSYAHLLKERYGEGLQLKININEADREKLITPLAMQVIIENAFSYNIISKANPLIIRINSDANDSISISNTVQPKIITEAMDFEAGLDNMIKKYELLNQPVTVSDNCNKERVIHLPLITKKVPA